MTLSASHQWHCKVLRTMAGSRDSYLEHKIVFYFREYRFSMQSGISANFCGPGGYLYKCTAMLLS